MSRGKYVPPGRGRVQDTPDGLTGEQIPFKSRVIAVVDAFVAVTSDRPYRGALQVSDALETIEENKGKQLDPKLAGLFTTVVIETFKRRAVRERATDKINADML